MDKNNTLLSSIKAKLQADQVPSKATEGALTAPVAHQNNGSLRVAPESRQSDGERGSLDIEGALQRGGFAQLVKELEAERDDLDFDRRIVYIDDETAEVLDLLRKKAKVKSNLLVSCLLHEFFRKHKDLIQELNEKRSNKFLD